MTLSNLIDLLTFSGTFSKSELAVLLAGKGGRK